MNKKSEGPEDHEIVTHAVTAYQDIISQILAGPANQEIRIEFWHEPEEDSPTSLWPKN